MKRCPVCGCTAFDDAETCYGCLHGFDVEKPPVVDPAQGKHVAENPGCAGLPGFRVEILPQRGEDGVLSWKCEMELVEA